jgi:hypothetical protein
LNDLDIEVCHTGTWKGSDADDRVAAHPSGPDRQPGRLRSSPLLGHPPRPEKRGSF